MRCGSAVAAADWSSATLGGARVIRLPAADGMSRYLWAGPDAPPLPPLPAEAWRWLEVRSGVPRVMAATADQFVPQMLNLELLGGVNFKKGCYPGQEVVARSQYRGTLKRRTYLMGSDAALCPPARRCSTARTRASPPAWWCWRRRCRTGRMPRWWN